MRQDKLSCTSKKISPNIISLSTYIMALINKDIITTPPKVFRIALEKNLLSPSLIQTYFEHPDSKLVFQTSKVTMQCILTFRFSNC